MEFFAAWAVFPVALLLVSVGCGLLIDRVVGGRLPQALIVPAGFTLALACGTVVTASTALAPLTFWVIVLVALAGYLSSIDRLRHGRLDWLTLLVALAVFVVLGAPVAFTGQPSYAGALALPDTTHQLILADRLATHGREFASLPTSSYQSVLAQYLLTRYPSGAQATLGALRPFGFQDLAWVYQPFITFMGALTVFAVTGLIRPWVESKLIRAGVSFVTALPALVVGYALQGSIKEVGAVSCYWTLVALVAWASGQTRTSARVYVPVVIAAVAFIGLLGPVGFVYLCPLAAVIAAPGVLRVARRRRRRDLGFLLGITVLIVLLALPLYQPLRVAFEVNNAVLSNAKDLGNLARPLPLKEVTGVWLGQDFRYRPDYATTTDLLAGLIAFLALSGLVWSVRRRATGLSAGVGAIMVVSAVLLVKGSPYADGKVMMLLSPAVVLAAGLGTAALVEARGRAQRLGWGLLSVLVAGTLASSALAYRGSQVAPYDRYQELSRIDAQFSGHGEAFFNEYDEFAAYFLRHVTPRSTPPLNLPYRADRSRRPDGARDRRHRPSVKAPFDIDDMDTGFLQSMRLLVLRHSPVTSRAPSDFRRVWRGRFYDVWRRDYSKHVLEHLPLGRDALDPGAVAPCDAIRSIAARAREAGGRLAFSTRSFAPLVFPLLQTLPPGWFQYGGYPRSVVPANVGALTRSIFFPHGGSYRVWIEGSFGRAVSVSVDGRSVGAVKREPGNAGQFFPLGTGTFTKGYHRVKIDRAPSTLAPGDGDNPIASLRHIGPVVFSPSSDWDSRVQTLPPSRAGELCGKRLDWIEIVKDR